MTHVPAGRLPAYGRADDFDRPTSLRARFQELAQVWAIDRSLLLDCASLEQVNNETLHLRDSKLPLLEFYRLLKTHLLS